MILIDVLICRKNKGIVTKSFKFKEQIKISIYGTVVVTNNPLKYIAYNYKTVHKKKMTR